MLIRLTRQAVVLFLDSLLTICTTKYLQICLYLKHFGKKTFLNKSIPELQVTCMFCRVLCQTLDDTIWNFVSKSWQIDIVYFKTLWCGEAGGLGDDKTCEYQEKIMQPRVTAQYVAAYWQLNYCPQTLYLPHNYAAKTCHWRDGKYPSGTKIHFFYYRRQR